MLRRILTHTYNVLLLLLLNLKIIITVTATSYFLFPEISHFTLFYIIFNIYKKHFIFCLSQQIVITEFSSSKLILASSHQPWKIFAEAGLVGNKIRGRNWWWLYYYQNEDSILVLAPRTAASSLIHIIRNVWSHHQHL